MACTMLRELLARSMLALFLFHTLAAAALNGKSGFVIAPRQSPSASGTTGAAALVCQEYELVANLSTIGLNSTYRAAFLRSSTLGTDAATSILDTQSPKLPAMMMDANLNQQCGNLSTIAAEGAAANFSAGTVAGMTIKDAPGADPAGIATPFVVIMSLLIFGGTFIPM